jgi:DNA-binding Lrp family transcriptional regulator
VKRTQLDRLPIFRSHEQARLLTEIFAYAEAPLSLKELAERAGVSSGGVHKEVSRLEAAGLVSSQRVGRTRLVSAAIESPFYEDLRRLLTKAFGPAVLLRRALSAVSGIEHAFIYGSWAAAEHSIVNRPPRDIDVMVLGDVTVEDVYTAVAEVEVRIGRPINVSVFTPVEWETDTSGFAQQVRSGPQIEILS